MRLSVAPRPDRLAGRPFASGRRLGSRTWPCVSARPAFARRSGLAVRRSALPRRGEPAATGPRAPPLARALPRPEETVPARVPGRPAVDAPERPPSRSPRREPPECARGRPPSGPRRPPDGGRERPPAGCWAAAGRRGERDVVAGRDGCEPSFPVVERERSPLPAGRPEPAVERERSPRAVAREPSPRMVARERPPPAEGRERSPPAGGRGGPAGVMAGRPAGRGGRRPLGGSP